jgi:hypothetical protein
MGSFLGVSRVPGIGIDKGKAFKINVDNSLMQRGFSDSFQGTRELFEDRVSSLGASQMMRMIRVPWDASDALHTPLTHLSKRW